MIFLVLLLTLAFGLLFIQIGVGTSF